MLLLKTNIEKSDENVAGKIYELVINIIAELDLTGWFINLKENNIELFLPGEEDLPADMVSKIAAINNQDDTLKILATQHLPLTFATDLLSQAQPFSTVMQPIVSELAKLSPLEIDILSRHVKKHEASLALKIRVALEIVKGNHHSKRASFEKPVWVTEIQQDEATMQRKLRKCIRARSTETLQLPHTLFPFDCAKVFRNLPVHTSTQEGAPSSFEIGFVIQPNFEKEVCAPFLQQHSQPSNDSFAELQSPAVSMGRPSIFDMTAAKGSHEHGSAAAQRPVDHVEIIKTNCIASLREQLWDHLPIEPKGPGNGTNDTYYERNAVGDIIAFRIRYNDISETVINIQEARCALADALDITGLTTSVQVESFTVTNVMIEMPKIVLPVIYQVGDNQYEIRSPYLSHLVRNEAALQEAYSGRVVEAQCYCQEHPTEPDTLVYLRKLDIKSSEQPIITPGQKNLYKYLAEFILAMKANNVTEWENFKEACIYGRTEVRLTTAQDQFNIDMRIIAEQASAHDAPSPASLSS